MFLSAREGRGMHEAWREGRGMQEAWHGVTYDAVLVDLVPLASRVERPRPANVHARHLRVLHELEIDLGGVARHLVLAEDLEERLRVARLRRHDEQVDAAHVDDLGLGRASALFFWIVL